MLAGATYVLRLSVPDARVELATELKTSIPLLSWPTVCLAALIGL